MPKDVRAVLIKLKTKFFLELVCYETDFIFFVVWRVSE